VFAEPICPPRMKLASTFTPLFFITSGCSFCTRTLISPM